MIHRSEETRMVLLLDIHHPDLSEDRRRLWRRRLHTVAWEEDGPKYAVNYDNDRITSEERGKEEL